MMLKSLSLVLCFLAVCYAQDSIASAFGSFGGTQFTPEEILALQAMGISTGGEKEPDVVVAPVLTGGILADTPSDQTTFVQRVQTVFRERPLRRRVTQFVTSAVNSFRSWFSPTDLVATSRDGRQMHYPEIDRIIEQIVDAVSDYSPAATLVINILKILFREIFDGPYNQSDGRSEGEIKKIVPGKILDFISNSITEEKQPLDISSITFQIPFLNWFNTFMATAFPNDLHTPQTLPWWRHIFGTNDHLPDRTVIGSWVYLSLLVLFCSISVISGLSPIAGIVADEEDANRRNIQLDQEQKLARMDLTRYDELPEEERVSSYTHYEYSTSIPKTNAASLQPKISLVKSQPHAANTNHSRSRNQRVANSQNNLGFYHFRPRHEHTFNKKVPQLEQRQSYSKNNGKLSPRKFIYVK